MTWVIGESYDGRWYLEKDGCFGVRFYPSREAAENGLENEIRRGDSEFYYDDEGRPTSKPKVRPWWRLLGSGPLV